MPGRRGQGRHGRLDRPGRPLARSAGRGVHPGAGTPGPAGAAAGADPPAAEEHLLRGPQLPGPCRRVGGSTAIRDTLCVTTTPYASINVSRDGVRLHTPVTRDLDYEGELSVVVGRRGAATPREQAWEYVFGYTLLNDLSARDLQRPHQ